MIKLKKELTPLLSIYMRIISGSHKGRKILAPKNINIRPTTDKSKEALFNILNNFFDLEEISVLDLFSGTGSISYEFASRGVTKITAVENNYKAVNFIKRKSSELNFPVKVVRKNVLNYINNNVEKFDFIFMDPPYSFLKDEYQKMIEIISKNKLTEYGIIIVEHSINIRLDNIKGFFESRKYGSNCFSIIKKKQAYKPDSV